MFAFSGCTNLETIDLPLNLTTINNAAFSGCTKLESIVLPPNLTTIQNTIFDDTGLSSVNWEDWPAGLTTAGGFGNAPIPAEAINGILQKETVTAIGANAFRGNTTLEKLTIPANITSIGNSAFRESNIQSLTVLSPKITTTTAAFNSCAQLTSVDIYSADATIAASTFANCSKLTSVSIPGWQGTVAGNTFNGCSALENILLPEGVKEIGTSPFAGTKIKELVFPSTLKTFGNNVINNSGSVETVVILAEDFTTAAGVSANLGASVFTIAAGQAPVDIYALPGTVAWNKLQANTTAATKHKIKSLAPAVRATIQQPDGTLLYANPALRAPYDNAGAEDGETVESFYLATALDAWIAAVADGDLGNDITPPAAFALNGVKHDFGEAGAFSLIEGDELHFFSETSRFIWFEREDALINEMYAAPGLNYTVTLWDENGSVEDTPVYAAKFADMADYAARFSTGTVWSPVGQSSLPDAGGRITLNFPENGVYLLTAYDPNGTGRVAYNFLTVTVYAPDNKLIAGAPVGEPELDTGTELSSGYQAGDFVQIGDGGAQLGAGFDPDHLKYTLYVNAETQKLTLPLARYSLDYQGSLTLTAALDGQTVFGPEAADGEGRWEGLGLDLSAVGASAKLLLTASCEEAGETFERVYEITVTRDANIAYAGIRHLEGALGLGIGQSATLYDVFARGADSYTFYIHPGQTEAVLDVTVDGGTILFAGGVQQTETAAPNVFRVTLDCENVNTTHTLRTYRGDTNTTAEYTIKFLPRSSRAGVFTPDRVYDYRAAEGQFAGPLSYALWALVAQTHYYKFVSLGGFGGYATYYYDDPIVNDPRNPYGVDFIVYGNAFEGGTAGEPAGAQVSYDGETWYDLAGQRHYELNTRYVQNVPLLDGGTTESLLLYKTGDSGNRDKTTWGYADVANSSEVLYAEKLWSVRATPYNPYGENAGKPYITMRYDPFPTVVYEYPGGNVGDMFDLSWAVDKEGRPVELPDGIRYIRLQNVIDVKNPSTGEVSPEIGTITRVNPASVSSAAVGLTAAPTALTVNGMSFDDFTGEVITNNGQTTYYDLDLKKLGSSVEVVVKGAEDDNIFINMEGYYGGEAKYTGLLDENSSRVVRVVVQNGEAEPRIYVINCVNGGDPAANADIDSILLAPAEGDPKLPLGDSGAFTASVASNVERVTLQVRALNPQARIELQAGGGEYAPVSHDTQTDFLDLAVGENRFNVKITSVNGDVIQTYPVVITRAETRPADEITVRFALRGDDKHGEEGAHNAKYWIGTETVYEKAVVPAESTAKYLTDMTLINHDLRFVTVEGLYISQIQIPGSDPAEYLGERDNGPQSGWMYRVNGELAPVGYADLILQDSDMVLWFYSDDGELEKEYEAPPAPPAANVVVTAPAGDVEIIEDETTGAVAAAVTADTAVVESAVADALNQANAAREDGEENVVTTVELTVDEFEQQVDAVYVALPAAAVTALLEVDEVTLFTPVGEISLDRKALETAARDEETLNFVLGGLNEDAAAAEGLRLPETDKAPRVYEIRLYSVGSDTDETIITNLGAGRARLSLPYDLPSGGNQDWVAVWHVQSGAEAEKLDKVRNRVAYANSRVTFTPDHFSYYAVGYDPVTEVEPPEQTDPEDPPPPPKRPIPNGGSGPVSNVTPPTAVPVDPAAPVTVSRATLSYISGADRVLTSVAISRQGWESADTVILAPGGQNNLIDALAVAPLAGQEDAPILLSTGGLDPAVVAEIQRLGAKKVYAVGALSQAVIEALRAALPGLTVETLRGASRFETAALIGAKLTEPQGTFVVGYNAVADAVSAASFAAAHGYLIQIADPSGNVTVAAGTPATGAPVYILGGPALVRDISGATRLYGATRYETNKAIRDALPFEYANIYTADGGTLVDALTGSALAAKSGAAIVLTPGNDPAGVDFGGITAETKVYAFGGNRASAQSD
jgi:hypothetical protein